MWNRRKKSPTRSIRRRGDRQTRRLRLEALERRDCPAVLFDFVPGDEGGVLTITGDEEDNYIAMRSVGGGIQVALGDGSVRMFENVGEVVVNSLGGADTVDAPKFWVFGTELPRLQIHAGAGNDRVTIGDGEPILRRNLVTTHSIDAHVDLGEGTDKLDFQIRNHDIVNVDVNSADSFDSVQVVLPFHPLPTPVRLLHTRSANIDINLAGGGHTVNVQTQEVDAVDLSVVVYGGRAPSDPTGNTIYISSSGGGVWKTAVEVGGDNNVLDLRTTNIDEVDLDMLVVGDNNVVKHELGHSLGFRHEHTRPETTAQANLTLLGDGNDVEFNSNGHDVVGIDVRPTGNGNHVEIALSHPAVQKVREAAARVSLEIVGSNNDGTVSNDGYADWRVNFGQTLSSSSDPASASATQGRSLFAISTSPLPGSPPPTGTVTFFIDGNPRAPGSDSFEVHGQGFGAATVEADTAGGNDSIWIDVGAPLQLDLATGAGDDDVTVDNQPERWFSVGPAPIQFLSIDTGGGDDKVVVRAQAGDPFPFTLDGRSSGMVVDLGDGNDLATISSHGFAIDSLTLTAGDGHDTVAADSFYGRGILKSTDSGQTWNVDLGGGDDHLELNSFHYGVVATAVNAGDGNDTVETRSNVIAVFLTTGFFEVTSDVKTQAGDDKVSIHNEGFTVDNTSVDTGDGNDTVDMFSSRAGVGVLKSTDGGRSSIENLGTVTFTFTLGIGDDRANINTIGYGEVNGVGDAGDGDDTIVSNSSPTPAGATAAILYAALHDNDLYLGGGNDHLTIGTSGAVNTNLFVDAGEGNDTIISNVAPPSPAARPLPVLLVLADHDYYLGAGDDHLVVNIFGAAIANILIDAGAGNDHVKFKPLFAFHVAGLDGRSRLNFEALLGAGHDRLEADTAGYGQAYILINGGDGDDEIRTQHQWLTHLDRTLLNLVVLLGAGSDTLLVQALRYSQVMANIDTGPAGNGQDLVTASIQFTPQERLRRIRRVVDGGLDLFELFVGVGYDVQMTTGDQSLIVIFTRTGH